LPKLARKPIYPPQLREVTPRLTCDGRESVTGFLQSRAVAWNSSASDRRASIQPSDISVIPCQREMATFSSPGFNLSNQLAFDDGIVVAMTELRSEEEAMSKIIKEPFAPPKRVVRTRSASSGWRRAFFALINLMFFKQHSSKAGC
jgi:hypothetical protein